MNKHSHDFTHMLSKARDAAAGGINAMSTGEALAAALVLNRPDWLAAMNYTIAEAIDRIGPEWANLVPAVAKEFDRDAQEAAYAAAERARSSKLAEIASRQQADDELEFNASLVTYGDSPGYRDVTLVLDLDPIGANHGPKIRASVRLNAKDGETAAQHIKHVHEFAWSRSGGRPIDAEPNEQRPRWLGNA